MDVEKGCNVGMAWRADLRKIRVASRDIEPTGPQRPDSYNPRAYLFNILEYMRVFKNNKI